MFCNVNFLSCQGISVLLKSGYPDTLIMVAFQKERETALLEILMFNLIDRYVFTPGVDKVKKLFELCEKKNTSNERPDMKEEPVATESVKGPTLDEKTPESDTKISTFAEEVAQRERKNDSSGPEMNTGDNFI